MGEKVRKSLTVEVLEWAQALVLAFIVAYLIRTFVFTLVMVDGPSMQPTLETNDRLFVTKLLYKPHNGDVIVFKPANNPSVQYVKRVIAVGGQEIDIDYQNSTVYVDGDKLDEPYINEQGLQMRGDMNFPAIVPEDSVFVMGDNRNNSRDSRRTEVGFVSLDSIVGRAVFRFWPFEKFGAVKAVGSLAEVGQY
ncbi:MAG: signal peptidase I [Clostridiales bacterium]|jgi:signal peptidase I|nr:signal peptidase I [Clostridiales bacterium]